MMRRSPVRLLLLLFTITAFAVPAGGEVITVRKEVRQLLGSAMSQDDARIAAIAMAKRLALEEAGTYLETLSVVRNAELVQDEILALSSGVLKTEIVEEQPFMEGSAFGIRVVAMIRVDTTGLEERVKTLLADRVQMQRLKDSERRVKTLLARVKELEERMARMNAGASPEEKETLKTAFRENTHRLTAQQWYEKGTALWDSKKRRFDLPEKAIEYFGQAIRIDPGYPAAYNGRGIAYDDLKQHQRAIEDYDQAIQLDPDDATAYVNRGATNNNLKQYRRAIEDLDQAIQIDPDIASAYNNRGNAYKNLKQYRRAIEDLDVAIRLDPSLAGAYNNRGSVYGSLKQYQRSIEDLDMAIRLDPDLATAYGLRGIVYTLLRQDRRAIEDFGEAIRLDPDLAMAYVGRGFAHDALGEQEQAKRDWRRACELGEKQVCNR
ncbi:MAG: tetratricopeptide repeat protein [Candidatus Glassbacteria bacterium]|nr:tetratricopeptide repeat protein [Candidatus Glassbacteria bacterium]